MHWDRLNTGVGLANRSTALHMPAYCLAFIKPYLKTEARGGVVVKALRYKPVGRGFDSRWCHWNFSVT